MRRMTALALLALAACQPQAPQGKAAGPPAGGLSLRSPGATSTVSDFSQDMTARGTEPFWTLSIRGKTLTLKRPGEPDLVAQAPGAVIQPGAAAWTAKTPDGQVLKVTLYMSDCSEGTSELRYPMAAEVEWPGGGLRGCAAKTAQLPKAVAQ